MLNQLNSILIEGCLIADPKIATTPKGVPVTTFSIASNRYYRKDDETIQEVSFFEVEAWAKLGENCGNTLTKGRGVRVVGRIKQDRWTGADGMKYSKVKIIAEHVEFKPVSKPKEGTVNNIESNQDTGEPPAEGTDA